MTDEEREAKKAVRARWLKQTTEEAWKADFVGPDICIDMRYSNDITEKV